MAESLRKNTAIREIDPDTELAFPSPPEADDPETDQSANDGLAILRLLWQNRRLLYRTAVWAFAAGTVVALLIPNQYESSVSIMPPESMNSSGAMLAALAAKASPELAAMAGGLMGMRGSGALFAELFRSRSVQDGVVDRLNLQQIYRSRYKQDARKQLNNRTEVSEDRKSGVVSLMVTDKNPQRARDIAQTYVEELNRLVSQVTTSSARRERIFIEQRLTAVKSDLEDSEKQFAAFASKNSTLDIKEQTKAMVESAGLLQGQLIVAESELQGLEQIYTGSNVRVRSLQARVDELKRQLQKLEGTDASLAAYGISGTDQSRSQPADMYPPIRKLPLLGVEWADLYRRTKIQETVYELLNQQYELARIQEAKEIPTVNVVDPASVPERKSSPHRLVIILTLMFLSLAGAAVWIVGCEHWERVDPQAPGKLFAENAWRDTSGRVATWLSPALTRFKRPRWARWNRQEPSE
jgi:capsule polysaccharide export protein KpsE/RkpR